MALDRMSCSSSLIDMLDRILDKGVVLDPSARLLLTGIDLAGSRSRVVVESMDVVGVAGSTGPSSTPADHTGGFVPAGPGAREIRTRK